MKVDRRKFLSIGAGATAGIGAGVVLSPIPWKLMDDSSIWTQNWPWTPVPQDGKVTFENSICTLCPGRCGITVRKVDDRVVKIEGMEDHPISDGGICLLGLSGPQLLYGPTRVKTPLKRVGDKWEEISWDDAISEVVSKLSELRSKGKPETVASIVGQDTGIVSHLFERFLSAYGSPNFIRTPTMNDSYEMVVNLLQGIQVAPGFDLENANFVLSFGSGLIDGWGSPVRMFKVNSKWKSRKTRVYQIEPRLSNTAAKSDKWIPIIPGTEYILALGIAYVIIKESLYDKNFMMNNCTGFDVWKQFILSKFNLEYVSAETGISSLIIASIARDFARSSKPIAVCGRGKGDKPGSINEIMSVFALNALVGNINTKGGIFTAALPDYINWPKVKKDSIASKGTAKKRIDGAGNGKYAKTKHLLNQLPDTINSQKESPIQLLFVSGANPYYTMANTKAVKQAFDKIPFIVSFSSHMDETAQSADLILPNHTYLERYEDVPPVSGSTNPIIGLAQPVVKPQFNTKHVGDTIIHIAKALKGNIQAAFPWDSFETCLKKTLGHRWKTLSEKGFYAVSNYLTTALRGTYTASLKKIELAAMIRHHEDPIAPAGNKKTYPLTLIPADSIRLASGSIGNPPFAIKTVSDTVLKGNDIFIEMNPQTAEKMNFSEGQSVKLSTPIGSAMVNVHLFDGIRPDIIAMPRGLGHTAYDDYLANKGVNFNQLIGSVADSASGLDAAWGIRAKLTKA